MRTDPIQGTIGEAYHIEAWEYVWDAIGSSKNKLAGKNDALEAMVTALKEEINELKGELKIFKVAIEQYFHAMSIKDDTTKVNTVAMYFTDVALLWWRRRSTDMRRSGTEIRTLEEFQKEYVREFSELMLQIFDLSEKEAFFSFTDGLKPWAKQELQRRGVQELTNAMMVAESLVELVLRRDRFESSKPNGKGNVEDVSYGINIDLIEWNAMKALSEVLVAQEIDMKPTDSIVE
ncbi:hypothetical protein PVK06_043895 [Gossypium arboreum]|uniref:Retrotransposon gag domain-containing protein n=1 Tax=Gossypium arboreum TaxID=29729 RepID=A0ABR0MS90_GOSAR|nr:hypothetical protein PVK06_043895 [Gossypium arboreum]